MAETIQTDLPRYPNGRYYRPAVGRALANLHPAGSNRILASSLGALPLVEPPGDAFDTPLEAWRTWWERLVPELRRRGYARSTLVYFRTVLRKFQRFAGTAPGRVTGQTVSAYLAHVAENRPSWHWTAMNLCVIRTLFDKIGGKTLTRNMRTPKRGKRLPVALSGEEVQNLLDATETPRDYLLLGLLYGCGLKPGEIRRLRWLDVDLENRCLTVPSELQLPPRELRLPENLLPILTEDKSRQTPEAWIFPGLREKTPISARTIRHVVRTLAQKADILREVSPMTLRHSFAVQSLKNGANVRELQECLGHKNLETTMRYSDCMLPEGVVSPLDHMFQNSPPPDRNVSEPAYPGPETAPPGHLPDDNLNEPPSTDFAPDLLTNLNPQNPVKSFFRLLATRFRTGIPPRTGQSRPRPPP